MLLGFSSGLPLALTGSTLQAWLSVSGVDLAVIGLFSLVGLPYTVKFLWSPVMDRFVPPWLDRRRGWILGTQAVLLGAIMLLGFTSPQNGLPLVAALVTIIAFTSASQDIVVDAYRTDLLHAKERGFGVAVFVTGYRIAMLASGALALILSDTIGWRQTYFVVAAMMLIGMAGTFMGPTPQQDERPPKTFQDAVFGPMKEYFGRSGAVSLLLLIILYKLGDAYAGTLTTAFLIKGLGFTSTEVGTINKGLGLVSTIAGSMIGGALMVRMSMFRALMLFGIFQGVSNAAFMVLALAGKSYSMLIVSVAVENLTGGMGTAAFVALIMALCNSRFSATQYALLSSLASLGRVVIAPSSGFVVDAVGWASFFFITILVAIPGLVLLYFLKDRLPDNNNN